MMTRDVIVSISHTYCGCCVSSLPPTIVTIIELATGSLFVPEFCHLAAPDAVHLPANPLLLLLSH